MSTAILRPAKFWIMYNDQPLSGQDASLLVYGMRFLPETHYRPARYETLGQRLFELPLPDDLWFEKLSAWLTSHLETQLVDNDLKATLLKRHEPLSTEAEAQQLAALAESASMDRYEVWLKEQRPTLYARFLEELKEYEKEQAAALV